MILIDLLENFIILKSKDRDKYYEIKDNIDENMSFIKDKLGYDLIIKEDFIKLEKIPSEPKSFMGIPGFTEIEEYIFFMILLMFLEDKNKEEQFVLSNLTEYISINYTNQKVEWTNFKTRKNLINVIKAAINIGIIEKNDGDEESFQKDENMDVLFENTGISRYIVRNFKSDIQNINSYEELLESNDLYFDKSSKRRNSVYRNLLLCPIVYNKGVDDSEYDYIKKYRGSINKELEENLNWSMDVHKNGALIVLKNPTNVKDTFPNQNKKGESEITLIINDKLHNMIKNAELEIKDNDTIIISNERFKNILLNIRTEEGHGFIKKFRECSDEFFIECIKEYMADFSMIIEDGENTIIMPLVSKVIGKYPKDYKGGTHDR
ncbi:MAG: TIGR02678 family protein [Intestinibacter bartlettii]|uniref:TIGR02678 family protein n=1 Tax=Intestinibacter bartlettii TaxID=261299 RepID=UPI0039A25BDA